MVDSTVSGRHFPTKTEMDNRPLESFTAQQQCADLYTSAFSPLQSREDLNYLLLLYTATAATSVLYTKPSYALHSSTPMKHTQNKVEKKKRIKNRNTPPPQMSLKIAETSDEVMLVWFFFSHVLPYF